MGKSLAFVKGKGCINHNNREFITSNVDKDRIADNITYVKQDVHEAYHEVFGKAQQDYNDRQKRNDRKINDYYERIRTSKNGEKPYYENVVQVGDMFDSRCGTKGGETAKQILDQYAKEFQERNPNLHVFNMTLHMDEKTPHLHIDYIPVAHGYTTGMETRNSLTQAFSQMGYTENVSKFQNNTKQWQDAEKARLIEIMKEHGIEHEEKGCTREHLTNEQYKAAAEIANKKAEKVKSLPKDHPTKHLLSGEVTGYKIPLKDFKKANKALKGADVAVELYGTLTKELQAKQGEIEKLEQLLKDERKKLQAKEQECDNVLAKYRKMPLELQSAKGAYEKLQEEHKALRNDFEGLQDKAKNLQSDKEALTNRFEGLVTSFQNVTRATKTLVYGEEYKDELTPKGKELVQGIENYTVRWLEHEGFKEQAKEIATHYGVSYGIKADMQKELDFKSTKEGKGLYTKQGEFLVPVKTIAEAKAMFPNIKINNRIQSLSHER